MEKEKKEPPDLVYHNSYDWIDRIIAKYDKPEDNLELIENEVLEMASNYSRTYDISYQIEYKNIKKHGLLAISDIDTRAVVRYIRDKGAMNGIISSETTDVDVLTEKLNEVPSMEGLQLCDKVSTKEPYFFGDENAPIKISALDIGIKKNILRNLMMVS